MFPSVRIVLYISIKSVASKASLTKFSGALSPLALSAHIPSAAIASSQSMSSPSLYYWAAFGSIKISKRLPPVSYLAITASSSETIT